MKGLEKRFFRVDTHEILKNLFLRILVGSGKQFVWKKVWMNYKSIQPKKTSWAYYLFCLNIFPWNWNIFFSVFAKKQKFWFIQLFSTRPFPWTQSGIGCYGCCWWYRWSCQLSLLWTSPTPNYVNLLSLGGQGRQICIMHYMNSPLQNLNYSNVLCNHQKKFHYGKSLLC